MGRGKKLHGAERDPIDYVYLAPTDYVYLPDLLPYLWLDGPVARGVRRPVLLLFFPT